MNFWIKFGELFIFLLFKLGFYFKENFLIMLYYFIDFNKKYRKFLIIYKGY